MNKVISILLTAVMLFSTLLLAGCSKPQNKNLIFVGTISGPETELMLTASKVALQKYGLRVKSVQFGDYTMPNAALNSGDIDANLFQHQPYLMADIDAHRYDLVAIGKVFIYPMGIYSQKYRHLNQIPNGAIIAVPNDPTNETRALLLLQKAGLITLRPGAGVMATLLDTAQNPRRLQIRELDAAQLPRVLPDVAAAVINTNYAVPAGLLPSRDAIFKEGIDSLYANVLVVRRSDQNDPRFQELLAALRSPEVLQKAQQLFQGQAIPAWQTAAKGADK